MKPTASPHPNREWIEWVANELNRRRRKRAAVGSEAGETPKQDRL
jgi:hypothetical protein